METLGGYPFLRHACPFLDSLGEEKQLRASLKVGFRESKNRHVWQDRFPARIEISTFSFTFLLKSLLFRHFSIEISTFSLLFWWNLYILFTFLLKSRLFLHLSIEITRNSMEIGVKKIHSDFNVCWNVLFWTQCSQLNLDLLVPIGLCLINYFFLFNVCWSVVILFRSPCN